jgi:hypothetical protein
VGKDNDCMKERIWSPLRTLHTSYLSDLSSSDSVKDINVRHFESFSQNYYECHDIAGNCKSPLFLYTYLQEYLQDSLVNLCTGDSTSAF